MLKEILRQQLKQGWPKIKRLVENSDQLGALIEQKSPWLSRQILSLASEADLYQVGMGIRVIKLDDNEVEAGLPRRKRSQTRSGGVHLGALVTLAEFTSHSFWARQLGTRQANLAVKECHIRILKNVAERLSARMSVDGPSREMLLFKLRRDGTAEHDSLLRLYSQSGHLVAEVNVVWQFKKSIRYFPDQGEENIGDT